MSGKSGIISVLWGNINIRVYVYILIFYMVYILESHTPLKIESVCVCVCVFAIYQGHRGKMLGKKKKSVKGYGGIWRHRYLGRETRSNGTTLM